MEIKTRTITVLLAAATLVACVQPGLTPQPPPPPVAAKPAPVITPPHRQGVDTQCSYFYFLWGKTAENNGRLDEALDAYEKAVVCDGEADYVIRSLTVLLLRMNRKQQALEWVEKLVQAHPDDHKVAIFQADLYGAMDENDKAIAIYQAYLAKQPRDPEVLLRLGKQYLDTLDYLKARDVLELLLAVEPDSFVGHYYLARLYRELKFTQMAGVAYQKALALNWSVPLALEVAEFYDSQRMFDDSVALYEKLLDDDEGREEAGIRLVRIYLGRNQSDRALALLRNLRGRTTDSERLDVTIGRLFVEQRRYPEAIAIFSEMLVRHPDSDLARTLLAMAYYEAGDRERAKSTLRAMRRGGQGYDDAVTLLVKIYSEEKDYSAAIALVGKMIKESPDDDQRYRFLLSSVYEEQGKLREAERVLAEAIQRAPKVEAGYFSYGMFLERQGRLDEAMAQMERILTVNPDDPLALNYIGYSWAERGVRLPEALSYIEKALKQRPEDGFILDSLGWVHFRMGNLEEAIAALEKSIILEPGDTTIHEHLGDVYLAAQRPELARQTYTRALELSRKEGDRLRLQAKIAALPQP